MPASGNGMVPNAHQRKDWQKMIKTWFNQPARAQRRHNKRVSKARAVAPRPLGLLRPICRSASIRHNNRVRLGRGFTNHELRFAKISKKDALKIGIAVDRRRRSKSNEAMQANIQRLREYRRKLILFPKNSKKTKKGEASAAELKLATQLKGKIVMPLKKYRFHLDAAQVIDPKLRRTDVYSMLIDARSTERKWGMRAKKAREAAEEANVIGKK
uniref:Large ribosomal subunit protein eL13 n=1 Tax=Hirondellea gigas TaxID=1518452 RepID=A0A2P2HW08_9CRUS